MRFELSGGGILELRFQRIGHLSLRVTTSGDRAQRSQVTPVTLGIQKKVQPLGSSACIVDVNKGFTLERDLLRVIAVNGMILGASPKKEDLYKHIEAIAGVELQDFEILADQSFMITMKNAEEASALVESTTLYLGTFPIHMEAWTPQ